MFDLKEDQEEEEIEIKADAYIKVMSLVSEPLNLSTEPKGRGRTFRFEAFAEVKPILYADLLRIMENNATFFNAGYFIILDKKFIRKHGLEDSYSKILNKDRIETLFNPHANQTDAVNIFKATNDKQKEAIINLLLDRMLAGSIAVDLNFLRRLSDVVGYDIAEKFKDIQEANANLTK